jgi:hypothetical protein
MGLRIVSRYRIHLLRRASIDPTHALPQLHPDLSSCNEGESSRHARFVTCLPMTTQCDASETFVGKSVYEVRYGAVLVLITGRRPLE